VAETPGLILVVNAGSSSCKLRLLGPDDVVLETADLPAIEGADAELVAGAIAGWPAPVAVGHRVVHGGTRFVAPVVLDTPMIAAIEALSPLAPLHQPRSLAAISAVRAALPELPHVAAFDTAFHATLPDAASTYAIPASWRALGVRRYGFHGLSHAYASRRATVVCGRERDPSFRVVTCHLGAGASLAAVRGGRSIDTTMGFTPLEGLVMATRSGSIDPGIVSWLVTERGMPAADVGDGLEHRSGLAGLAGTDDMRAVLERSAAGDGEARLGLEVYIHRLRALIAAMVASLGGIDALVFTGGVGERSAPVRTLAAEGLGFLGVTLDGPANDAATGAEDAEVSAAGAAVRAFVVPAREEIEIAGQVRVVLRG
jgi:acetate kinase